MKSALIGFTGFVGGNLRRQHAFDHLYNSANIERLAGERLELLVCAGAPGAKWIANREPGADRASLARLTDALGRAAADHVVLISTVDVYPEPLGVDEDSPIDPAAGAPYGRHRLALERFVAARFEATILRLPGLFGPGLKKNVIHDLLHAHRLEAISPESVFQFYDLNRLWHDVERARQHGIRLLNVATEPTSVREVARHGFGLDFENPASPAATRYDFRTRHDAILGGARGYLYDREQVLGAIRRFVEGQSSRRP